MTLRPSEREPGSGSEGRSTADEIAELRRLLEAQRDVARAEALEASSAREQLRMARAELARLRERRPRTIARMVGRRGSDIARRAPGRALRSMRRQRGALLVTISDLWVRLHPRGRATVRALEAEAALPARTSGPLVSMVMLNRNGAALLRRTLPSLAATAYTAVELIVVDNASTDESLRIIKAFRPGFPVTVIRNAENRSFSEANNQGVAASRGELLLFLNNDVEPAGPNWLGPLVDAVEAADVGAAGARLVYPSDVPGPRAGRYHANLTVQHAGVRFRSEDGMPIGLPMGVGSDPAGPVARATRDVPALTAACLLVRASAFQACGGFTGGYDYGQEDVDLCLKMHEHGWRLVYEGRSILWHHESATRSRDARAARKARIAANRRRFTAAWGPRLYRSTMRSAIAGDEVWREPLRVHLVGAPGVPTASLPVPRDRGWSVADGPLALEGRGVALPDVVVVADPSYGVRDLPPGIVRVAWIAGEEPRWREAAALPDFDVVLAAGGVDVEAVAAVHGLEPTVVRDGPALSDALLGWVDARRVTIRAGIPSWETAHTWGDLHFARDLARSLRRQGWPVRIDLLPGWEEPSAARDDVAIHLFGLAHAPTHPGQVNALWHISHPDRATPEMYERYDIAFVASRAFADRMRSLVRVPVVWLGQATDPGRFTPRAGPAHTLLFVANSRGVRRRILDDLLPTEHELAVFGRSWTPDLLDPTYVAGDHVPNDDLAGYYSNATIVLNDHWPDMRREGFLSNRLYDASAAGAFVVSDAIDGLYEEFDGGVVSYHGREELRQLIERYVDDADARTSHAARARAAVLARHTFDQRAREILARVDPLVASRPAAVES